MSLPYGEKLRPTGPADTGKSPSPTRKVLIVDDCQDARSILQLLLTKLGHQARTAEDVRTGIAISRAFRPEIVFCDLMMAGGLSGYAFAKAARQEQELAGLCIVAVSGWEGPEYEKQAYDAGFDRLLTKPVGLSDLQQVLLCPPKRSTAAEAPPSPTGDEAESATDPPADCSR